MPTAAEFWQSCDNHALYPENVLDQRIYLPVLQAYKQRLEENAKHLCVTNEARSDLRICDFTAENEPPVEVQVQSLVKLKQTLRRTATIDISNRSKPNYTTADRDPRCRFIFLIADHSQAPLNVTKDMLTYALSYQRVMPRYLDLLLLFGRRHKPRDLTYSAFRDQTQLTAAGTVGPQVLQICYNLKAVAPPDGQLPSDTPTRWSVRQAAIYHRLDVQRGTTLWTIAHRGDFLLGRINQTMRSSARASDRAISSPTECFRTSLVIHSLLVYWAMENWAKYIVHLENMITDETDVAVFGSRGPDQKIRRQFAASDLQNAHRHEEHLTELGAILQGNIDVLVALKDYYTGLGDNADFSLQADSRLDIHSFSTQMVDAIHDLRGRLLQLDLLKSLANQRKTLILQHVQSQAAEEMRKLSILSQKEAIAMRIITVVTLLYLPATFVSTFFGTDIVKYQNGAGNDSTSWSGLAMYRWLQVTLPLTFVTCLLSWLGYRMAQNRLNRQILYETFWKTPTERISGAIHDATWTPGRTDTSATWSQRVFSYPGPDKERITLDDCV